MSVPGALDDTLGNMRTNGVRSLLIYCPHEPLARRLAHAVSLALITPHTPQFERARALHTDWLAGRAQGRDQDSPNSLPSTRSMLAGSLFGRLGR